MDENADARNRAWRTFIQALGIDVASAVAAVLVVALTDIQWTKEFWIGIGLLAAKTAVQTVVAYVGRKAVPPPTQ